MINLNILPCVNCKNFGKIRQPDGSEMSEFIFCKVAKQNKADNLLSVSTKGKVNCERWEIDNGAGNSTDY